jgi:hypothetical protein
MIGSVLAGIQGVDHDGVGASWDTVTVRSCKYLAGVR